MTEVLCPELAEDEIIITIDNIDSLRLSSYERVPGTRVEFSCLSGQSHVLNGTRAVTCLSSGQWNSRIPTCVPRHLVDGTGDGIITKMTTQKPVSLTDSYDMLPYLVALAALGVACILLIILLSYALYTHRRKSKKLNSSSIYDSYESGTSQMDLWIEMAGGPRHFRCHELASSHDDVVHNLRYTNIYPGWSGY